MAVMSIMYGSPPSGLHTSHGVKRDHHALSQFACCLAFLGSHMVWCLACSDHACAHAALLPDNTSICPDRLTPLHGCVSCRLEQLRAQQRELRSRAEALESEASGVRSEEEGALERQAQLHQE